MGDLGTWDTLSPAFDEGSYQVRESRPHVEVEVARRLGLCECLQVGDDGGEDCYQQGDDARRH
jgi:hypothetical protein